MEVRPWHKFKESSAYAQRAEDQITKPQRRILMEFYRNSDEWTFFPDLPQLVRHLEGRNMPREDAEKDIMKLRDLSLLTEDYKTARDGRPAYRISGMGTSLAQYIEEGNLGWTKEEAASADRYSDFSAHIDGILARHRAEKREERRSKYGRV
jgi:hypothetical protein